MSYQHPTDPRSSSRQLAKHLGAACNQLENFLSLLLHCKNLPSINSSEEALDVLEGSTMAARQALQRLERELGDYLSADQSPMPVAGQQAFSFEK